MSYSNAAAHATAATLRSTLGALTPHIAIILGSGLGALADAIDDGIRIPYTEIPHFPDTSVAGHAGTLVAGLLDHIPVLIFSGRLHIYEGHTPARVAFPVRLAHALGARTLIVSNAVGAINPSFTPGDLMIITDHLNLMAVSPLTGPHDEDDIRFPDMSAAYDPTLQTLLRQAARELNIPIREGVFAALPGPSYETPAEIRMLRTLGADAVCMSTVPEVIAARALSMRVAGISCVTNMAAGVGSTPPDHAEVLRTTAQSAHAFQSLVRQFISTIHDNHHSVGTSPDAQ